MNQMSEKLQEEVQSYIDKYNILYTVYDFIFRAPNKVFREEKLSLEFLKYYIQHLRWGEITLNDKLWKDNFIVNFLVKNKKYINWANIYNCYMIPEDRLKICIGISEPDEKDWERISHSIFSENFLREYANQIRWDYIQTDNLSENFLEEFSDKINWRNVCYCNRLSEKFIVKHVDKISWKDLSSNGTIIFSEEFIREYRDLLNLNFILECQTRDKYLSDDFIEWILLEAVKIYNTENREACFKAFSRIKLSEDLYRKYENKLDFNAMSYILYDDRKFKFSNKFLMDFKDRFNWEVLSEFYKFSKRQLKIFDKNICWSYTKNIFNKYSYKPKFIPRFIKDNELLIGFEAEVSFYAGYKELNDIMQFKDKMNGFYYFKHDSSCDIRNRSGMEINSHPFSYEWLMKNKKVIRELCALKKCKHYSSHDYDAYKRLLNVNGRCGFHIHLSRNFFTIDEIEKMSNFIYDHEAFIKNISLRVDDKAFDEYAIFNQSLSHKERHSALNLSNKKTIEIRFFQGTLNYRTIMAYLEFAYALSMFVKKSENTSSIDFVEFAIENNFRSLTDLLNGKLKWNDGETLDNEEEED